MQVLLCGRELVPAVSMLVQMMGTIKIATAGVVPVQTCLGGREIYMKGMDAGRILRIGDAMVKNGSIVSSR